MAARCYPTLPCRSGSYSTCRLAPVCTQRAPAGDTGLAGTRRRPRCRPRFSRMFSFVTAGNSHGPGLSIIVQGVPAGLALSEEYIAEDLHRRQGGFGRGGRMKIESDYARITAGVRHGLTMGDPIALQIENRDWANWTTK